MLWVVAVLLTVPLLYGGACLILLALLRPCEARARRQVRAILADREWRSLADIADRVDAPLETTRAALAALVQSDEVMVVQERRPYGARTRYGLGRLAGEIDKRPAHDGDKDADLGDKAGGVKQLVYTPRM